jgi:predicted metal-binding transcription factor (methanogenesis marker protein 9)
MTNEEMLAKMGISPEEFADLLKKHADFMMSLSSAQRAVVRASMPCFTAAAESFGPIATIADLQRLLEDSRPEDMGLTVNFAVLRKWSV